MIKEVNAIHISKNYAQNLGYDWNYVDFCVSILI